MSPREHRLSVLRLVAGKNNPGNGRALLNLFEVMTDDNQD